MSPRLKMSQDGLELLKSFEGLRLTAARLPDGRWTMGHGHTQYAREGATITEADAEALLLYDLIPVTAAVNEAVTVEISQNQFDALVCFAFNVGVDAFRQSEVLTRVNQERMTEAALAMAIWRAGAFDGRRIVLDALVRRRSAEEALLLGTAVQPSPSDMVRPEVDPVAEAALPDSRPADLRLDFAAAEAEAGVTEYPEAAAESPPEAVEPEPEAAGEAQADAQAAGAGLAQALIEPAADSAPEPAAVDADDAVEIANDTGEITAETIEPTETEAAAEVVEVVEDEAVSPEDAAEPSDVTTDDAEAVSGPATPERVLPDDYVGDAIMTPAPPAPSPTVSETSLSTRVYATYPTEPFAPLSAAEPEHELEDPAPLPLDADPVVSTDSSEPPLVLVLTSPPEQTGPIEAPAAPTLIHEPIEGQTVLFEPPSPVEAPADDGLIVYETNAPPEDRSSRWSDATAYFATGAVGLAAFGFGVAGFHLASENPVPDGVFDEKSAIAWVLVLIGAVCVGISAYNLFKRLGMDEAE